MSLGLSARALRASCARGKHYIPWRPVRRPASTTLVQAVPENQTFYGRQEELKLMRNTLASKPSQILLLTGPAGCGKTALLDQLAAQGANPSLQEQPTTDATSDGPPTSAPSSQVPLEKQHFYNIDLKSVDPIDPAFSFARELAAAIHPKYRWSLIDNQGDWWDVDNSTAFAPPLWLTEQYPQAGQQPAGMGPLLTLLKCFQTRAKRCLGVRPDVIVIDHADLMLEWPPEAAPVMRHLLHCLLRMVEGQQLCHVVLATSNGLLGQRLAATGAIRLDQMQVMTLGELDYTQLSALLHGNGKWPGLLQTLKNPAHPAIHVDTADMWLLSRGNTGAARRTVMAAYAHRDLLWTENPAPVTQGQKNGEIKRILQAVATQQEQAATTFMESAFSPAILTQRPGLAKPDWTPEQWAVCLRSLAVDYEVHEKVLAKRLGENGLAALHSLVNYRFLCYRQPSKLATDIPMETYISNDELVPLITAAGPADREYILSDSWRRLARKHGKPLQLQAGAGKLNKEWEQMRDAHNVMSRQMQQLTEECSQLRSQLQTAIAERDAALRQVLDLPTAATQMSESADDQMIKQPHRELEGKRYEQHYWDEKVLIEHEQDVKKLQERAEQSEAQVQSLTAYLEERESALVTVAAQAVSDRQCIREAERKLLDAESRLDGMQQAQREAEQQLLEARTQLNCAPPGGHEAERKLQEALVKVHGAEWKLQEAEAKVHKLQQEMQIYNFMVYNSEYHSQFKTAQAAVQANGADSSEIASLANGQAMAKILAEMQQLRDEKEVLAQRVKQAETKAALMEVALGQAAKGW